MSKATEAKAARNEDPLSASVQVLPLPAGLYLFSVTAAAPATRNTVGQLALPAVYVGAGPGSEPGTVEFVSGPSVHGAWLFALGDMLITKVNAPGATLVMTSVRAPGGDVLNIKVERLDGRSEAAAAMRPSLVPTPAPTASAAASRNGKESAKAVPIKTVPRSRSDGLSLKVNTHIRSRGDLAFTDEPWAGRVAPGLWIESFSVLPQEVLSAQDIEYKGLTGSGFETPWITDDKLCGTRGMGVPLVGFAIRLKAAASAAAASAAFDCEYSGFFQSGAVVGPLRNGAPCRSTVANDPLEGIQVRVVKRGTAKGDGLPTRTAGRGAKGTRRL